MTGLNLQDITDLCGGVYHGTGAARVTEPNEIVIDSRKVRAGNLFAALPGEKVDGHAFVGKALDAGAAACLVKYVPEGETRPCIVVDDVAKAMGQIAGAYRRKLSIPVIGITGSVGKTTMKEMIACVLETKYRVLKTEKNFNNDLGVPMTVSRIQPDHRAAVIEMGISHFGEMEQLAEIVRPDAGVFTVIGHSHLEALHDRRGVLQAKTEMIPYMPEDGTLFFNGDDDLLARYKCELVTVTFGTGEHCDVRAENISINGTGGTACDIVWADRRFPVTIHAYGKHMVTAALGAAAVAMHFGMSDADIAAGIANYQPVGGRAAVIDTGVITLINDCYNANPDSMSAALESLSMLSGRKVAVLGDMYELGEHSAELHREVGRKAARCGVDALITCGELGTDIALGAEEVGTVPVTHFSTREALLEGISASIQPGDNVLVKASHGLHLETVVEHLETMKC